jgi:hypothetical protein
MKTLTGQQIRDFLDSYTTVIEDTPFRKLKKKGNMFFVYDEDGRIKTSTLCPDQAARAYNAL